MVLFFLSSGLFLGWSLGANDAANVFGSAVGSKMVKFRTAAIIAGIFVILGAVIQGAGASHTLGKLGAVSALGGSFTVALAAGLTVFAMTKWKVPVSTSQAIVGAIIGWNFYTGNATDMSSLTKIVSTWVAGPILGGIFAIVLYLAISSYLNKAKIHLVKLDAYVRFGLLAVGAFGSYSLGANNIANVMGVFIPAIPLDPIDFGLFTLSGAQQLFLVGSIAIAIGIITFSKRVMNTVGNDLMDLSPVSALVVVLSHSLVLFVFSSQGLSNFVQSIGLPAIPLVPVSSSQAIVGAIIGLGLLKGGGRNVNFKVLGSISIGWITTPIIAGVMAFISLFFVNNVFKVQVAQDQPAIIEQHEANNTSQETTIILNDSLSDNTNTLDADEPKSTKETYLPFLISLVALILLIILFFFFSYKRKQLIKENNSRERASLEQIKYLEKQVNILQKKADHAHKELESEIKYKKKQMMTLALNIIQKNEFIQTLRNKVVKLKSTASNPKMQEDLQKLSLVINEHLYLDRDRKTFQLYVEELNQDFYHRLEQKYGDLTTNEKRLCALLRLNLASKEIASVLNISPKSVEMNRYRLRKKLKISGSENLHEIIQSI
ncbi:MAG: hypothetical protein B7C24_10000 [Bacteroidetes bacterium 4572_77]|nr:MAG: hypothetical protein B7C24_10000 [Bacteroidetes bacterium 4572_77]